MLWKSYLIETYLTVPIPYQVVTLLRKCAGTATFWSSSQVPALTYTEPLVGTVLNYTFSSYQLPGSYIKHFLFSVSTVRIPCKSVLDVGFLLDSSGSVGLENYATEKNFVKLISREVTSTSRGSRTGVIVFSDFPYLSLNFKGFSAMPSAHFEALIDTLPYQQGRTRIDLALGMAAKDLFVDKRSGVHQVGRVPLEIQGPAISLPLRICSF